MDQKKKIETLPHLEASPLVKGEPSEALDLSIVSKRLLRSIDKITKAQGKTKIAFGKNRNLILSSSGTRKHKIRSNHDLHPEEDFQTLKKMIAAKNTENVSKIRRQLIKKFINTNGRGRDILISGFRKPRRSKLFKSPFIDNNYFGIHPETIMSENPPNLELEDDPAVFDPQANKSLKKFEQQMERHLQKAKNLNILIQSSDKKNIQEQVSSSIVEFEQNTKYANFMAKRFIQEANSFLPVRVTPLPDLPKEIRGEDEVFQQL